MEADGFEVRAKNIAKLFVFFWNIKKHDAPELVPTLWFFNFETEELSECGLALSFWRQNERDRSIRVPSISDQLLGIKES